MRKRILGAAAAMMMVASMPASAATLMTKVTDYNAFVLGSYSAPYGDVEGRLAVGGSASLTSFGTAQTNVPLGDTYTLVVGGALTYTNGQVHQGSALVGGAIVTSGFGIPHGSIDSGTGLDFAAEGARLRELATDLAARTANGTVVSQYGTTTLTGGDTGLNVFTLSASALYNQNVALIAPAGSSVLVNVIGGDGFFEYKGFSVGGGVDRSRVLFNFADATSVTLNGVGIQGSLLAANAAVSFTNGQINGLLIAASLNGPGQINYAPYAGGLLDIPTVTPPGGVPEPATWALMILGMGAIGGAMRKCQRDSKVRNLAAAS